MVAADDEVAVPLDVAARGVQVAAHELQQRALPRAVGAHQRHARVAVDAKLQVLRFGGSRQPLSAWKPLSVPLLLSQRIEHSPVRTYQHINRLT